MPTRPIPKNTCPRCGGGIPNDQQRGQYQGALSRWTRGEHDTPVYVCSACGQDEAMIQLHAAMKAAELGADQRESALQAVHPITGHFTWWIIPSEVRALFGVADA